MCIVIRLYGSYSFKSEIKKQVDVCLFLCNIDIMMMILTVTRSPAVAEIADHTEYVICTICDIATVKTEQSDGNLAAFVQQLNHIQVIRTVNTCM